MSGGLWLQDSLLYAHPRTAPCLDRAGKTKGLLLALHGLMRSISGQAVTSTSLDLSPPLDVVGNVGGVGDGSGDAGDAGKLGVLGMLVLLE